MRLASSTADRNSVVRLAGWDQAGKTTCSRLPSEPPVAAFAAAAVADMVQGMRVVLALWAAAIYGFYWLGYLRGQG